jgi:hypothetical protein
MVRSGGMAGHQLCRKYPYYIKYSGLSLINIISPDFASLNTFDSNHSLCDDTFSILINDQYDFPDVFFRYGRRLHYRTFVPLLYAEHLILYKRNNIPVDHNLLSTSHLFVTRVGEVEHAMRDTVTKQKEPLHSKDSEIFEVWCGRRDLNPHTLWALPPQCRPTLSACFRECPKANSYKAFGHFVLPTITHDFRVYFLVYSLFYSPFFSLLTLLLMK